uniref:Integrase, catalytic region, zinc finger, CCHC-type, peptidase aspartic, catalytic n=1 Tax=Tanacetum cinerariifolium TaxID=118510 RepID=A0A6L2LHD7_TANCI|nr:integrase, catalytic region, zinc finger, CCHC-type, peptidase aspartic, catalytic [Tanacetum cinerariifolium]
MTLNVAWKFPRKLVSTTHLHVRKEWEARGSLRTKEQGISMMPPTLGKINQALTKDELKHSQTHKINQSPSTPLGGPYKEWNQKPVKVVLPEISLPRIHKELNKNLSAPKHVNFINSIVILSINSDPKEDDISLSNEHDHKLGNMIRRGKEVKEQGKEEDEIETDEEVEEKFKEEEGDEDDENFNSFPTMKELSHHEWLLKNPRHPWTNARIRTGGLNNIKISCIIGHFFTKHAYIDLESPISVMSRHQYNQIMTYEHRSRWKPSNPNKINNFVGRVRHLKIFIGSFAYECDFMILEETTSIIDLHLGEMVFGRPFIDETGLVYNEEEGTVMFEEDDEKITFQMPHTMEIFKQKKHMGLSTDSIPLSAYEENFGHGRTHYYQSLLIKDKYKQDEGDRRGIRHLMRLEKEMMDNKGEVTKAHLLEDKQIPSVGVFDEVSFIHFLGSFNLLNRAFMPKIVNGISKYVKAKSSRGNKKEWKPTRRVFSSVGHRWLPTAGNVTISRVYYVEGIGHNLFSVGQLCDSDFEVAFRKSKNSSHKSKAEDTSIFCICLRYNKTPYELMHGKKLDLSYLHAFGSLCYPTNDSEDLGKLKAKANIGLVPNPNPQTPYVSPTKNEWDLKFQLMFDEYFNPSQIVVSLVQAVLVLRHVDPTSLPSSTFIDKDAPLASISPNQALEQSLIISQVVEESPQPTLYDNPSSNKSSTSKESSKGNTSPKTSKTRKSIHAEETVEEATHEVVMDVEEPTQEKAKNNVDQPQSKDALKTSKIPNKDLFKQPTRPSTPYPKWNIVQTISDEP